MGETRFEHPHAKVVAIVGEQLFEAGTANVGELDLSFLGGKGGFAAFQDVLFAGARGLDHLVHGAVALAEILVRETEGEVVDDFGFLVGEEGLVITAGGMMGWEECESEDEFSPPLTFFAFFPWSFMAVWG